MPRRVALGALIVALAHGARASTAAADAEDDARAVFGLGDTKRRTVTAPVGCDPTTDFGCAFASDPFATVSPFALTSTLDPSRWRDLAGADLDHDALAALALGANRDDTGPTFGAASGLENRWLVEGAATESLRTGGVETRVPLRFLSSMRVQAGGFSAADRASTGGAIDAKLIDAADLDDHELIAEVWASAGAPRRDLPPIPQLYEAVVARAHDLRALSLGVVARGPLPRVAGARPWYAGGIRPVLYDDGIARTAQRLVDVDANALPDLDGYNVPITERIDERDLGELGFTIPALVRAGATRGPHTVEVTGLVTAYRDTRWISRATESAAGIRRNGVILDGIATWRGTWPSWRARVIASWHRHTYREKPRRGRDDTPQIATAFVPANLPEEPAIGAACDDVTASDPYPGIPNCPVPRGFFSRDGVGLLFAQTADRPALVADVAHRLGRHTLAAGATGEDGRLVTRRRYTGGVAVRSLFGMQSDSIEFIEVGDFPDATACSSDPLVTDRCRRLAESSITFRTRYLAAYARDTYRPITPLALDAGLRWESFTLGDAFTFSPELAPRAGAAWDFLGGGRSRAFVGLGRSFALVPAG